MFQMKNTKQIIVLIRFFVQPSDIAPKTLQCSGLALAQIDVESCHSIARLPVLLPFVMLHSLQYFECKGNDVVVCASMNTTGIVHNKLNSSR